jgi:prephenate dehydratase
MANMRVAYQGIPGAYSEAAILEYFSPARNENFATTGALTTLPCESFETVFAAVQDGTCEYGLIPIENSLAGSIHRNFDLLLRHQLSIVGEYYLRVKHCLISLPGVSLAEIRKVISHPQALAQCEAYLRRLGVPVEAVYDTAGSVKMMVEQGDRTQVAIASRRAAELYQVQILAEGIEDAAQDSAPLNYTRFLVIASQPVSPQEDSKTSIVFSLRNLPGALFKALSVFALREIDLTKIESRPLPGTLWQYLFYIDIAGSACEPSVSHALDNLAEFALMLRVLGSYPWHRFHNSMNAEEKVV